MRVLFFTFLLLAFCDVAHAHPVDDLCRFPNRTTEDGCKVVVKTLMMTNELFHAAVKEYWHCRRLLVVEDITETAKAVGASYQLSSLLRENYEEHPEETALLGYWNVIPAHPEFDELDSGDLQKNLERVAGQTAACLLGRAIDAGVIYRAREKQKALTARVQALIDKPAQRFCCDRRRRNCRPC